MPVAKPEAQQQGTRGFVIRGKCDLLHAPRNAGDCAFAAAYLQAGLPGEIGGEQDGAFVDAPGSGRYGDEPIEQRRGRDRMAVGVVSSRGDEEEDAFGLFERPAESGVTIGFGDDAPEEFADI